MTVYVDDMRASFGLMVMCHMIADNEDELHAMAARIGVARKWYQKDHYDVALSKRTLAVKYGAVEVTWREAGAMMAIVRRGGKMPGPKMAVIVLQAMWNNRERSGDGLT